MRRENLPDLFRQQLAEFLDLLEHELLHERDRLLTVVPVLPSAIEEMGVSRLIDAALHWPWPCSQISRSTHRAVSGEKIN